MQFEYSKIFSYLKTSLLSRFDFFLSVKIKKSKLRGFIRPGRNSIIINSYLSGCVLSGERCKILDSVLVGDISIGRYTSINGPNTDIYSKCNSVKIGSFTSIARNVTFQEYNHKRNRISTYLMGQNIFDLSMEEDIDSKGGIKVGNDVWIGNRVTVLGGVTIGDGAIIATNSLVNTDIPPYSIVGGIPAKLIKYRFTEDVRESLLKLKWWDWSIEKIKRNKDLFLKEDFSINDLQEVLGD